MRIIVHLSDLHFGRVDEALLSPLIESVHGIGPDLVVVSGDLTQRARGAEFRQARAFFDRLPGPLLAVPGNHDVPLNPVARLLWPLAGYRRHISMDLAPMHVDAQMAVLGVNSARALAIQHGAISPGQIAEVEARLAGLPEGLVTIVASHHPFGLHPESPDGRLIGGAAQALGAFGGLGVDILLSGHVHRAHSSAGSDEAAGVAMGRQALVVSAGTATSTRRRSESNAFNVLRVEKARVEVEVHSWSASALGFVASSVKVFERDGAGWRLAGQAALPFA